MKWLQLEWKHYDSPNCCDCRGFARVDKFTLQPLLPAGGHEFYLPNLVFKYSLYEIVPQWFTETRVIFINWKVKMVYFFLCLQDKLLAKLDERDDAERAESEEEEVMVLPFNWENLNSSGSRRWRAFLNWMVRKGKRLWTCGKKPGFLSARHISARIPFD